MYFPLTCRPTLIFCVGNILGHQLEKVHPSLVSSWQAEALCSQPVRSFVRWSVRPCLHPLVRLLRNFWTQYFENKWNDFDANRHKWSTGQGSVWGWRSHKSRWYKANICLEAQRRRDIVSEIQISERATSIQPFSFNEKLTKRNSGYEGKISSLKKFM